MKLAAKVSTCMGFLTALMDRISSVFHCAISWVTISLGKSAIGSLHL